MIPAKAGPLHNLRDTETEYCGSVVRPSRRALRALLRMTYILGGIKKNVILRRPRSGRLEGRTAEIQCLPRVMQRSREGRDPSSSLGGGSKMDPGLRRDRRCGPARVQNEARAPTSDM